MKVGLTFDDVSLVPQFNNVPSRTEPDLGSWLTRDVQIQMPLVPANMDSVINTGLADIVVKNGGIPIFHRFAEVAVQKEWIRQYDGNLFISCGTKEDPNLFELLEMGPAGVCIDVAHGHSDRMFRLIKSIKDLFPTVQVIAGNVCTPMAFQDLANAGADAVKVGVGAGAACTTRMVTGFGVPQFTAIQECGRVAKKLRIPLIADGGIRNSRDILLALAANASMVMVGKLFALTEESAAEKRGPARGVYATGDKMEHCYTISPEIPVKQAKYRGQASEDFQNEYYGGLKEKTVAEGTSFWAPVIGNAQGLIDGLLGGLRHGLTYGGARNIKELQRKAEFMEVTGNYGAESRPRGPEWLL